MIILRRLLPLLVALLASPHISAGPFPEGDPKLVGGKEATIRGIISRITIPVSDNVESDPTYTGLFLITPDLHGAEAEDTDGEIIRASDQMMFQITGDEETMAKCATAAGVPVEVTAIPMHAHTRHHRTPFLLIIQSLRALPK